MKDAKDELCSFCDSNTETQWEKRALWKDNYSHLKTAWFILKFLKFVQKMGVGWGAVREPIMSLPRLPRTCSGWRRWITSIWKKPSYFTACKRSAFLSLRSYKRTLTEIPSNKWESKIEDEIDVYKEKMKFTSITKPQYVGLESDVENPNHTVDAWFNEQTTHTRKISTIGETGVLNSQIFLRTNTSASTSIGNIKSIV